MGDPLKAAFNFSEMALAIRHTRDAINNIAHILAEQPEGYERAKNLASELSGLQVVVNVALEKMGATANERKWHQFFPDLSVEANRK